MVRKRALNTSLLCMLMLMIGYSSYALIVLRSAQNTPMDQNSPEDIFSLGTYLNREQYGQKPLLYGQAFTSQAVGYGKEESVQRHEKKNANEPDKYDIVEVSGQPVYPSAQKMLFPRMFSRLHAGLYQQWLGGVDTKPVEVRGQYEGQAYDFTGEMPSQWDNLRFFLSYQVNFMYWRYFMWNFAGRQNDLQGNGEPEHGNWITGISFIDNSLYGDQNLLPDELKANKGHNVFYCLPLLLGLIGLFWQAWRGKRGIQQFWVVFFLFFMTGLAIVIYLNQTPSQPRERDYAYAASFYAYAIWCGLGVLALYDWARKLKVAPVLSASVISLVCLLVPIQMASQTWDDHDRSGRYTCRDFGQNYLNSLQQKGNPIIFTNGDNDTFPLWYNQEVEGVRTDTRVCNLSYLQTDWYIDQMRRPAYNSPSVPISWPRLDYVSGTNEYVQIQPEFKEQIREFYKQDPVQQRHNSVTTHWIKEYSQVLGTLKECWQHVIPTDTIYMTIDKEAVRRSGMMRPGDSIPDRMVISLAGKQALYKNDLMMLEMIANCNWTRPLYVAVTVGAENFMNLGENFIQEGLVNRITPFSTMDNANSTGINMRNFDTEKTYDVMMNRFKWGGLSKPGLYIDETVARMCYTHRREMAQLAMNLILEGKKDKALKVLEKAEKVLPTYNLPLSFSYVKGGPIIADAYYMLGKKAKAEAMYNEMWKTSAQYIRYYLNLSERYSISVWALAQCICRYYTNIIDANKQNNPRWAEAHNAEFMGMLKAYEARGGKMQ